MTNQEIAQDAIWDYDFKLTKQKHLHLNLLFKDNIVLKLQNIQYDIEQYDRNFTHIKQLTALSDKDTNNNNNNGEERNYRCILWSDYYLDDCIESISDHDNLIRQDILKYRREKINCTTFEFFPKNRLMCVEDWQSDDKNLWDQNRKVTTFHYTQSDLEILKLIFSVISIAYDRIHKDTNDQVQLSSPMEWVI